MNRKRLVRLAVVVVVVTSLVEVGLAFASRPAATTPEGPAFGTVPPGDGVTVVATDSNSWLGLRSGGPRANAELVAFGPDGEVIYYDDGHTRYWDVDPVPGTDLTVEYLYADHLNASECGGTVACTYNGIARVNLSTGEETELFGRITAGKHSTRWHDADRLSDTEYVVADIERDRVFVVNTTTDIVTWAWSAQSAFDPPTTGGPFPDDWTHLNDVEVLPDGRFMASLRNHDRVVFLDRERGLVENWTLGDGSHEVLYEQHNPDFIANGSGPPSVLVADSENNRLVEYRRTDDGWERTWLWRDARLQWPRDADRLPNGHTLVTDSNGNRVFELDERGAVVWSVDVAFPYEAERLGTGDESGDGPPANTIALGRTVADGGGTLETAGAGLWADGESRSARSGPLVNSVYYVLPQWMGLRSLGALLLALVTGLAWCALEWRWRGYTVSVQRPVTFGRRR